MSTQEIKVSVCVVTYNQEQYIAECLDSLVSQQTNFKFEIIVGEDCSTDGTRRIIENFAKKYPNLIVPIYHQRNIGPFENVKAVYKAARGKYIAHMDGDDIALPGKLKKQFDTIESNLDCVMCVHHMLLVDRNGVIKGYDINKFKEKKYTKYDLYIIHTLFRHSSKMFINDLDFFNELGDKFLDIEIHTIQANNGFIYMMDEVLGGYRENVGITFKDKFLNPIILERVEYLYESVDRNEFTKNQYTNIKKKYSMLLLSYAYLCAKTIKDKEVFRHYIKKSLLEYRFTFYQLIFLIGALFPNLFFKLVSFKNK